MARTPLLSRLLALAAVSRRADTLGIDTAELLGRRADLLASGEGLTRSDLIKRTIAAGAGAMVAGRMILDPSRASARAGAPRPKLKPGPSPRPSKQPRIAIVGAGVSGLTAAMALKDAGFRKITVYEASDRIGGRTFTNTTFWEPGQWSEWGGELIDSSHELVFSLCDRFGFSTIDLDSFKTKGSNDILHFGGGYYPWKEMVEDWKHGKLHKVVKNDIDALPEFPWAYNDPKWTPAGIALDNLTAYDWIESRVPGGHSSRLGTFIDVAYTIEYGEDTSRQGASDLLGLLGYPDPGPFWIYGASDERWKIVGGNQQIALAQADYLGFANIQLGMSLASLVRKGDTVTATFDGNQKVDADHIILAVPLGVMKQIKAANGFDRAFGGDPRKLGFIDALGFGADNKLQLQITDRFWTKPGPWGNSDGESYSDTGFQEAWHVTEGQPGTTGVIVNYTGGDTSRALNPSKPFSDTSEGGSAGAFVTAAANSFLAQIEPVFPGMTARWTGKAMLSAWHTSPYQHGAYSYWTPGYLHNFSTYEAVPIGPIHFAGEHTSSNFQGYIEGAAEEGLRAAGEIIAAY